MNQTTPPETVTPPLPAQQQQVPGTTDAMDPRPDHGEESYRGSGRLEGKKAIITGGDSGIGRATAVLFAREGAKVAIAYLEEDDDARITIEAIEREGSEGLFHRGDLGDPKVCKALVEKVIDKWGRLDVLVNNAGEQHPDKEVTDITAEQLQRTFQTNIFSMFYLVQAARPHLTKGAAIVNCTSVTMYKGSAGLLDYSATKGAITAFTRSLSENLIKDGIRVNAVAPGPVQTGWMDDDLLARVEEIVPMGRAGDPEDIADAVVYLASHQARWVTGQVLQVAGGHAL